MGADNGSIKIITINISSLIAPAMLKPLKKFKPKIARVGLIATLQIQALTRKSTLKKIVVRPLVDEAKHLRLEAIQSLQTN